MIDDLLSPSRIEPLEPEPGAPEQAWEEVGRRRRARARRAQVAAALGLVLVVAAGILPSLGQETKLAKLDVAGPDSAARRIEKAEPPAELVEPSAEDSTGGGIGARPSPGPATGGPSQSPTAAPRPASPSERPPAGPTKPPVQRTRHNSTIVPCVTDWCLMAWATKSGDHYALGLDICVPVGARTRRFSYPTTQEADYIVSPGNSPDAAPVWTWSKGQTFPANLHHVDIPAGQCVSWKTLWDATDESGAPLEPGNYRLTVRSVAEQAGNRSTTSITFRIE